MKKLRPLKAEDVTFELTIEFEQESVRGHFGYETEAENKAAEDEIIERLDRGDERAWCWLQVTACDADGTEGSDSLGCVNLGEDAGWGPRLEATIREQFPELWTEALAALNSERERIRAMADAWPRPLREAR
jgi:hypothetical protein